MAAKVEIFVDAFLARHCTKQDDHDHEDCRKCAEMRKELLAFLSSAERTAGNVLRESREEFLQESGY